MPQITTLLNTTNRVAGSASFGPATLPAGVTSYDVFIDSTAYTNIGDRINVTIEELAGGVWQPMCAFTSQGGTVDSKTGAVTPPSVNVSPVPPTVTQVRGTVVHTGGTIRYGLRLRTYP